MSKQRYALRVVALVAVLLAGLLAGSVGTAAAEGRRSYTGTIDGADFRVEVPERWNGTLVLFSHGYYPDVWAPEEIMLAGRKETELWLLDHGYALAGSNFRGVHGFLYEQGVADQAALLDWFRASVGRPSRTVANGSSMGAVIATRLAERDPRTFAGVLAQCSEFDANASFTTGLDVTFAVRALLAPGQDIDLVNARDPEASKAALLRAVEQATTTPQGRARLALAGALGNIPAWATAFEPRPAGLDEQLRQQALWVHGAYVWGLGPAGRVDLERRAGGNPSWNIGVDYRRQLARSAGKDLVRDAYRAAGLDLDADLDTLAAAPRIAPDPRAVAYMHRHTIARGTTPSPVVTLHNTGDGGGIPDQVRWYAEQARHFGDPGKLRHLYSDRGGHCAFNAAEEIVALRTLFDRLDTGNWPDTGPRRLNAAAAELGDGYRLVLDLMSGQQQAAPPSFTRFSPPQPLRPSR